MIMKKDGTTPILWSPPAAAPIPTVSPPPNLKFPESLKAEVTARIAFALSHAVQTESVNLADDADISQCHEPLISIYYPYDGCHDAIDLAVTTAAEHLGVDVLTLDALEIARGKHGALQIDIAFELDKESKQAALEEEAKENSSEKDSKDKEAKKAEVLASNSLLYEYFKNLVNLQTSEENQTASRIIYLRDFGSIAISAKPFLFRLLQVVRARRLSNLKNDAAARQVTQPTVVIIGHAGTSAPALLSDDNGPSGSGFFFFDDPDDSNDDLTMEDLHQLNDKILFLKNTQALGFPTISSTFFFTSLADREHLKTSKRISDPFTSNKKGGVDLGLSSSRFTLFVENQNSEAIRNVDEDSKRTRRETIKAGLLDICLRARGARPSDDLLQLIKVTDDGENGASRLQTAEKFAKATNKPLPAAICEAAALAISIACSNPQRSAEPMKLITADDFSNACAYIIDNASVRKSLRIPGENTKDQILENVESKSSLTYQEKQLMSCLVDCKKTQTTFSDISVSEYLIECLRLIIFVPMNFPDAFKAGVLKRESMGGVLLYGPPGTGKTMVCRAMASQWGMRMIQIKPSDLLSAFVGQSERVAKSIFSLAHRIAPCIIFIDEIESLLHRRGQGDDRSHQRSLLNEFLQGMEGLQSGEKQGTSGVVVIGATNRPFDIDEALLRRFPARYMVGLPDVAEREKILGIHLRETKLHKEVDIKSIARQTKKYSGSDLKNLCVAAATSAVKGAAKDFQWERLTRVAASGDSSEREEVKITLDDTEITKEDFKKAMSQVPASATKGRHEEIYEWHRKHGNKGDPAQTEKGIQKFIGPLRAFARVPRIKGVRLSFALTSSFPRDHRRK